MDDVISRQAATQTALEFIVEYLGGAFDEDLQRKLIERMNALSSARSEPQWIPCSERLPDKTDDYLCSYNGCAVADICEYDPDRNEWGFFYDGGWKVVSNVIAWLPLPEPYRGEEK